MGKTNKLTTEKRAQIVIPCEQGLTVIIITVHFNETHSCILKTLKLYHEMGDFKNIYIHYYAKAYSFAGAFEI